MESLDAGSAIHVSYVTINEAGSRKPRVAKFAAKFPP
jgi:hypothetical protein